MICIITFKILEVLVKTDFDLKKYRTVILLFYKEIHYIGYIQFEKFLIFIPILNFLFKIKKSI